MAIEGKRLYEEKMNQFGARSNPTRFGQDYISAVNYALETIDARLNTGGTAHIIDTDQNIALESDQRLVLSLCIDLFLIRMGHRSGELSLNIAFASSENALKDALLLRDHEDAAAATDAEVIGMLDD